MLLITPQVTEECGDIPMVLVQNKIDLVEDAKMRPYVVPVVFSLDLPSLSLPIPSQPIDFSRCALPFALSVVCLFVDSFHLLRLPY